MSLTSLKITHFRNIGEISIAPQSRINIIHGNNGAGKTSLLEAIYYLSSGKSFKTHLNSRIIQYHADAFTLFAITKTGEDEANLGLRKQIDGARHMKVNGNDIQAISEISTYVPLQLITTNSQRFFSEGPKLRRQFIDWGVFHVKPVFLENWRNFQTVLKQRNAAIKSKRNLKEICSWDEIFCSLGNEIHMARSDYTSELIKLIHTILKKLLPRLDNIQISYKKGWNEKSALTDELNNHIQQDIQTGYTQSGPHRADIRIQYNGVPIHHVLSQGQQKILTYAFSCAQAKLLNEKTNKLPIFLIDDLSSELDQEKQLAIIDLLNEIDNQVFITTIQPNELHANLTNDAKMFHMKQGNLQE